MGGGCCSRRTVRAASLAGAATRSWIHPGSCSEGAHQLAICARQARHSCMPRTTAHTLAVAKATCGHILRCLAPAGGLRYHHIGAVRVQSGRRAPTLKALNAALQCRVVRSFQAASHSTRGYPLFTGGQTCLADRRAGLFNRRTCAGHSQPWCHVANDGGQNAPSRGIYDVVS